MKIFNKIWTSKTAIIFLSILLIGLTYLAEWIEGWTGAFLILGAAFEGLLLAGFFILGLVKIIRTKDKGFILPLIIAIIASAIVVFRPVETIIEKIKSPVVLYGYCEHTVTGVSLKLREDNTFEYNAGAFLSREMHYGKYILKDDTLTLKFSNIKPTNIDSILLVTNYCLTEFGDTTKHNHQFNIKINNLRK
nr:hypothetical protein [uncultured Carboxylicivirga sp.]